ncbi:hypothetical protein [Acaryochloris sp. IP29b_bin.137]|uniref:hypothetical protein n=1 Tax=Acaryochloris sp. IP29b_bin.137 TaxID=2969217 RepID=UPI0026247FDF|nr:hypothetical protein [Acaryochloris sp. IP29b_bin.137]
MTAKTISRYLDRYAEPIVITIQNEWLATLRQTYQFVLAIPLFDEPLNCLESILPKTMSNTLIIAVVNASVDADKAATRRTQAFLAQFNPHPEVSFTVVEQRSGNTLLLIDCCTRTRQLPHKQGVGLARKIGGDIALACIAAQKVSIPWVHCTDGDVKLPDDYFHTSDLGSDVAVAIYPFCHHPQHSGIIQYEISLRYYVLGLSQAASPYAFQTIGSLLKINAEHYAKVRGFPKRQAAEDFYMLNKLAKTGKVVRLRGPAVTLSSRLSHRVPFGTGAAMVKLARDPIIKLYHPQIFLELQRWLKLDRLLWNEFHTKTWTKKKMQLHDWGQKQGLSHSLLQTLRHLQVEQALEQAFQQCHDLEHFQFFMRVWFDAFRTLKFVHYQREHYWPSLPIPEAISFLSGSELRYLPEPISTAFTVNKLKLLASSPEFLTILEILRNAELNLSVEIGPTLCLVSSQN